MVLSDTGPSKDVEGMITLANGDDKFHGQGTYIFL